MAEPAYRATAFRSVEALVAGCADRGLRTALVVDGASVPDLRATLASARLDGRSLFAGPDEEILRDEAPVLVPVGASDGALVSRLAADEAAAFVVVGHVDDDARVLRHLRRWLSVRLPLAAPDRSEEDKPVFFRFFDPAILTLFLATLTPGEAAAFGGPVAAWGAPRPDATLWLPTEHTLAAPPAVRGPDIFRIRPEQYAILAQHSATAYERALRAYLRDEFEAETRDLDAAGMDALIARAMEAGRRIEDTRPGAVTSLAVLYLLRPDIMTDDFVWAQVMGANPEGRDPRKRAGLFEAYHFTDLETVEEFDAFYARLARFWEFY